MTMSATAACTVCNTGNLNTVVDFGSQPPANRFIDNHSHHTNQDVFPLAFGYCADCGTAQLTHRMPFAAIQPRFDWLIYNEPEGHLDAASAIIAKFAGIGADSRVLGVTYKDQSTIDRLTKLGLPQGRYIEEADFDLNTKLFGLETIQARLRDKNVMHNLSSKYGKANIVLMRHIVEHSDSASDLVRSLKELVADNGYLVMELPDSHKLFKAGNHPFIWEEHISYFTEETIHLLAEHVGAEVAWFQRYPYPYEDSLMIAFRFTNAGTQSKKIQLNKDKLDIELATFKQSFAEAKEDWRHLLTEYKNKGEKVAIFGAGHLSAKFINFFQLDQLIDCVIDDNKNKAGMRMPGSMLPIVPSSELAARGIKICISTLSPESEAKVREKFSSYFNEGGIFLPAFAVVK